MEIEAGLTIDGLLDLLKIKREFTAVAVNREITPKSDYGSVKLGEGDKVEIVRPMGGGAR
jgi:thiamine biosynthesis protein ThiS